MKKNILEDISDVLFSFKETLERGENILLQEENEKYHRLTLRIPTWLLEEIDKKRSQRVGNISRNQWIVEKIEKGVI